LNNAFKTSLQPAAPNMKGNEVSTASLLDLYKLEESTIIERPQAEGKQYLHAA
jgi:hypothetical protein